MANDLDITIGRFVLEESTRRIKNPTPIAGTPIADAPAPVWLGWVLLVLVAFGIVCRVSQYAANRSFWEDEFSLLINVKAIAFRSLAFVTLNRTRATQAAPPVFLWQLKAIVSLLGADELAVRSLPILCGIGGCIAMAALVRRILSPEAAVWALAIFCISDQLIFQAANLKPYSGDALATVLLLLLATFDESRAGQSPRPPALRLASAALAAAALVWVSYPVMFVLTAIVAALAPKIHHDRRGTPRAVLALAMAALSFALVWWFSISAQRDQVLDRYWSNRFVDWSAPFKIAPWLAETSIELGRTLLKPDGYLLFAPILIALAFRRRDDSGGAVAACRWVLGVSILAASAHVYPFGGTRVNCYLLPALCVLSGHGISIASQWLRGQNRRAWRLAWRGSLAAVLAPALALASYHSLDPRPTSSGRAAVRYLQKHRRPGEAVYVVGVPASNEVAIYWPDADSNVHPHFKGPLPPGGACWTLTDHRLLERDTASGNGRAVDPSVGFEKDKIAVVRWLGTGESNSRRKPATQPANGAARPADIGLEDVRSGNVDSHDAELPLQNR